MSLRYKEESADGTAALTARLWGNKVGSLKKYNS